MQALLGVGGVDAPVGGHQVRRVREEGHMVFDGRDGLPVFRGMLQDLVARHDPAFHLVEDHVAAELGRGATLVPGNGLRVRLEEAEHPASEGTFLPSSTRWRCAG
jgi:hypothetical protein